ncbi:MAG TPA: hypothetical protein VN829_16510 [Dongiaceae bacterium]|nr:hypothetical protein [Dongiaceae bacterium]
MPGLENTGFFIPPPVIEHFLKDIEDAHYDGIPQAGVRLAQLQNPAYRRLLRLPEDAQGARVDSLLPIPSTEQVLKEEDVLLQIGSFAVASDAKILYQGNRVSAALAFQLAQAGESIPLQVWRDGRQQEVSLPVFPYHGDRAAGYQHETLPRFFVYGGVVFTPLSLDYLRTQGRGSTDSSTSELYYELYHRRYESPKAARPEPIVLSAVLADAVNANLSIRGGALVDQINGKRIEKLEDVVLALETNTSPCQVIEFLPNHIIECLDRETAAKANADILRTYGLSKDRRL